MRSQCAVLDLLSPCTWLVVNGVIVKKSTPKRTMVSTKRAGLSFFPAYFMALAQASISSGMVSPKFCTILLEMKAAMSPAISTESCYLLNEG